ncbi:hypothetical protein [Paraglaciecola sp.]|uniref:hypothetical protein n=1 Tax=Paraglaciecola sp. TaxID=1920173 RepID=UPI0030F3DBF8
MVNRELKHANNEAITACIYDENYSGVWLLFTKEQPEFIANIDKNSYQKILQYLSNYSLKRNNIYRFFEALNANSKPTAAMHTY